MLLYIIKAKFLIITLYVWKNQLPRPFLTYLGIFRGQSPFILTQYFWRTTYFVFHCRRENVCETSMCIHIQDLVPKISIQTNVLVVTRAAKKLIGKLISGVNRHFDSFSQRAVLKFGRNLILSYKENRTEHVHVTRLFYY